MSKTVYLSLGSNLGDPAANLREAIRRLEELGTVTAVSSFYETEPVEMTMAQPWFVNCALGMETDLLPKQFLQQILAIELAMGRRRTHVKGPRNIDIDVIFFGDAVMDTPELVLPHPAMQQRRFVLEPLAEIAAGVEHPVLKRTVADLRLDMAGANGVVRKRTR